MANTERLYYGDSYTLDFTARVVERLAVDGRPAVALDRTYFYPTGGGQPHDTGTIGGVEVVDVQTRDDDKVVLHILTGDMAADEVACHIDRARRFDYMQHHTGQHILTQAFVQIAGANTVGFHLGAESVTIDLDVAAITPDVLVQVEDLANRVLWENRPVTARLVDPNDAAGVRIRRMPGQLLTDGLRVIDIRDFDQTACGGTHVAHTGEIGIIKVLKLERRGEMTRVEFRCGGRALRDYREKNAVLSRLAADMNAAYWEVEPAIANLRNDLKETQRALKTVSSQLAEYETERLLTHAARHGDVLLVKAALEGRDPGDVRALASRLTQTPGVIALLGAPGEKAHIVFARHAALPHDMNALFKLAAAALPGARGGGRPELAQGGGVPADAAQVGAMLDAAQQHLLAGR